MTPVFFGTALGNFGVDHMLDGLTDWAPSPMPRKAESREVVATEEKFSGFVFKIQANMDPETPRPHRLYAYSVRDLQQGHEDAPRAHRQGREHLRTPSPSWPVTGSRRKTPSPATS